MLKVNDDDARSPKMTIYLKTVCIMSRRIWAALRKPLAALLIQAAIVLVPLGEGWLLLRLAFPGALTPKLNQPAYILMYWIEIWVIGAICSAVMLIFLILIIMGKRLWVDALREAKKSDSRRG